MHVSGSRKRKPYYTSSQTPFRARDAGPVPETDSSSINPWVPNKAIPFTNISLYMQRWLLLPIHRLPISSNAARLAAYDGITQGSMKEDEKVRTLRSNSLSDCAIVHVGSFAIR
jgi:hypothetical protein